VKSIELNDRHCVDLREQRSDICLLCVQFKTGNYVDVSNTEW